MLWVSGFGFRVSDFGFRSRIWVFGFVVGFKESTRETDGVGLRVQVEGLNAMVYHGLGFVVDG